MALEFKLPDIGEGVVEGEIVRWLVKEGDVLREDQPMVEVMTDKATVEIPTPRAGRVTKINVPAGKICAVGQVMVVIDTGTGGSTARFPAQLAHPEANAAPIHTPVSATTPSSGVPVPIVSGPIDTTLPPSKVLATPATRQLSRNLGVDIRTVNGSGPAGRITRDDVIAVAERKSGVPRGAASSARAPAPPPPGVPSALPTPIAVLPAPSPSPATVSSAGDERIPFRGVRRKIADNMAKSKQTAAHFTYVEECDVTELVAMRGRAQARAAERGVKLSYLPFIIKAVVSGLKKYPMVNSTLDTTKDEIVLRKSYHIGVATATESGLIVPVLREADKLSIFEIAARLAPLSERVRTGKASREELTGSTFTISSLGKLGGLLATPIINHPEVAILGVHKIKETPAVKDGAIVIRQVMNLSISLDHRIVDGYEGAMFLQHVVSLLEDPTLLFMELV